MKYFNNYDINSPLYYYICRFMDDNFSNGSFCFIDSFWLVESLSNFFAELDISSFASFSNLVFCSSMYLVYNLGCISNVDLYYKGIQDVAGLNDSLLLSINVIRAKSMLLFASVLFSTFTNRIFSSILLLYSNSFLSSSSSFFCFITYVRSVSIPISICRISSSCLSIQIFQLLILSDSSWTFAASSCTSMNCFSLASLTCLKFSILRMSSVFSFSINASLSYKLWALFSKSNSFAVKSLRI